MLQEAAINVSQYLALNVCSKRENMNLNQFSNKNGGSGCTISGDIQIRCPSPPATPLVAQLMEMGFPKKSVEVAIKAMNELSDSSSSSSSSTSTASVEQLVAWLLEYSEAGQIPMEQLSALSSNERAMRADAISATGALSKVRVKCTAYARARAFAN